MWYMLFADTIADRLCEADTITRDDLRAILVRRLEEARANSDPALFITGYEECLNALDDFVREETARSGYKPTGLATQTATVAA